MKRNNTSRGRPLKHRTPLALFKKNCRLTYEEIANETGESLSTLHKVSGGFVPMPLRMAQEISVRYGVARDWLLGEMKGKKPLHIEGVVWQPGHIPASPAPSYRPADKVAAYVSALNAVAREVGYSITNPAAEKWKIASAFDWYSFVQIGKPQIDQSAKTINRATGQAAPHMVEALRHLTEIEKRWNVAQLKFQVAKRESAEVFFRRKLSWYLSKARPAVNSPMLMQEVESLLSDAGRHPQSPLVANALMAALQQIRQRFKVPRTSLEN